MATAPEIKAHVRKYLSENLLYDEALGPLADDSSFLERNVLDSTGVLELVALLEDTYAIKVADDELVPGNLDSLELIAAYVLRKRGQAA